MIGDVAGLAVAPDDGDQVGRPVDAMLEPSSAADEHGEYTPSGIINCDTVAEADYVILGLDYDVTSSGGKGADEGPAAVAETLNRQIEPYNAVLGREPCQHAKVAYRSAGRLNTLIPEDMVRNVAEDCRGLLMANKRLTIIGGDHSVTIGAFMAYADCLGTAALKDIIVLHIDAHFDFRDHDEFRVNPYGKYAHCSVMRRAYEAGFKNWVQVGIRSYNQEEDEFAKAIGSTVFKDDHTARLPQDPRVVARAIETKKVWITLDADGICPGDMPGTGTPVGGGPSLSYVRELLRLVCLKHEVVCLDFTEVAPPLDPTGVTVYNAGQLIYDVLGYRIARERGFLPKPQRVAPKKKVLSKRSRR